MIKSFLIYVLPCLAINAALNVWYLLKLRNKNIARFDGPIDMRLKFFDGRRILGESTTWVGLPVAILAGVCIEYFLSSILIGLIKGLTVYLGHALGSFIKRRLGLSRGVFLPIVDHGDSIILTGVVFYFLHYEKVGILIGAIIFTLLVQPVITYSSYKLSLRDNPL